MKKYQINKSLSYIKDEDSVSFHVEKDDYFGTIATIIGLIGQNIEKNNNYKPKEVLSALKNLEKDLVYLQKNYYIKLKNQSIPKIKNKNRVPKGKLNNQ
jgi:transcription initiation factor IIE alpha subunit